MFHSFAQRFARSGSSTLVAAATTSVFIAGTYAGNSSATCESKSSVDPHAFLLRPLTERDPKKDREENAIEFDTNAPMRERMEHLIFRVQKEIVEGMEEIDGKKFKTEEWEREGHGGGGRSKVLQDGNVFEKGGVNVSVVHGLLPPAAIEQMRARGKDVEPNKALPFYACGISLVIHPKNPMAPTIHLNYRYFELETGRLDEEGKPTKLAWFGGGADLTPSYVFDEDARHFHAVYKIALDKHDPAYYPEMKETCDKYFYIPHRKESRGIGGFFFDDMDDDHEKVFQMIRSCSSSMLDSYVPIMLRRKDMPFTELQKQWQQLRRGRYVEFNVMYDRGTKFGLRTPGSRVESILMSLPLTARWEYNQKPTPGSWEDRSLHIMKNPVDWLNVPEVDLEEFSTSDLLKEIARRSEQQ